jgi:hypothetical protein
MAQPEGVTPSQEELLAELQWLKRANPEMGAKRLQAVVKEMNPTWLVSEARVKKVAVEAGLLPVTPKKPPADAAAAGGGAAASAPKKPPSGAAAAAMASPAPSPSSSVNADTSTDVTSAQTDESSSNFTDTPHSESLSIDSVLRNAAEANSCALAEHKTASQVTVANPRSIADENAKCSSVYISGATGPMGRTINGFYNPMAHLYGSDGRRSYGKRCYPDGSLKGAWLEHRGGFWEIRSETFKKCIARVEGGCALELCNSRPWSVFEGGELAGRVQHSIIIETGASATALRDSIADENTRCTHVYFSGATGPMAELINGLFEPKEYGDDGRRSYRGMYRDKFKEVLERCGGFEDVLQVPLRRAYCWVPAEFEVVLLHRGGFWEIRILTSKRSLCIARAEGGCALELCKSRPWSVFEGGEQAGRVQHSIIIETGASATARLDNVRAKNVFLHGFTGL